MRRRWWKNADRRKQLAPRPGPVAAYQVPVCWSLDFNWPGLCMHILYSCIHVPAACPGILFGGGGSTNSVEDRGQRKRGSGGGSSLVRGSGGSCNLVQEIPFHIVKLS